MAELLAFVQPVGQFMFAFAAKTMSPSMFVWNFEVKAVTAEAGAALKNTSMLVSINSSVNTDATR